MTIFETNSLHLGTSDRRSFCNNRNGLAVKSYSSSNLRKLDTSPTISSDISPRPGRRVRFADECGVKLINVILIDAYYNKKHTINPDRKPKLITYNEADLNQRTTIDDQYSWVISFIQPASIYNRFKSELSNSKVKLATAVINSNKLRGIIKVLNICFEKNVFVRISTDEKWSNYLDYPAKYHHGNYFESDKIDNHGVDEFEFENIDLPVNDDDKSQIKSLEFVLCYETIDNNGTKTAYWDNNDGRNYRLDWCSVQCKDGAVSSSTTTTTAVVSIPSNDHLSSSPSRGGSDHLQQLSTLPYTIDYKPNFSQFETNFTSYRAWNHYSCENSFY